MSLIQIDREDETYFVNSSNVNVSKFSDGNGNYSYALSLDGKGTIQLTEEEYQQFNDNNEEKEVLE